MRSLRVPLPSQISQIFSVRFVFSGKLHTGAPCAKPVTFSRFSAPSKVIQMLIEHQADVNHGAYGGAALPLTCLAVPADGNWDGKC